MVDVEDVFNRCKRIGERFVESRFEKRHWLIKTVKSRQGHVSFKGRKDRGRFYSCSNLVEENKDRYCGRSKNSDGEGYYCDGAGTESIQSLSTKEESLLWSMITDMCHACGKITEALLQYPRDSEPWSEPKPYFLLKDKWKDRRSRGIIFTLLL